MTAAGPAADGDDEAQLGTPGRRRPSRVVLGVAWAAAGLAVAAAVLFTDSSFAPDLLVGPIDHGGFEFLTLLAAALLVAAALSATAWALRRAPARLWRRLIGDAVSLLTSLALLLAAVPALAIGAFAFSSDYRTIGRVDGHELIVTSGFGLGQFPVSAGIRHGLAVDFSRTTGDLWTTAGPGLDGMRFRIEERPTSVIVRYTPAPRPGRAEGVLRVPKAG